MAAYIGSLLVNVCCMYINALPDDGITNTETCRSCFNVNFNVNFNIVFLRQLTSSSVGE